MKITTTAMVLSATLFLTACGSGGGLFGDRFANSSGGSGTGVGADGIGVSEFPPNSPQFFSQTIGDTVLFAVDQSTLSTPAQATLAAQQGQAMLQARQRFSVMGGGI